MKQSELHTADELVNDFYIERAKDFNDSYAFKKYQATKVAGYDKKELRRVIEGVMFDKRGLI